MKWLSKPPQGVPINFSHPLARGLVGFWLFQEGGGDRVADLSGNGNTGVLTGMALPPTATSGWNPSRRGVGLAFDGTNDCVKIGTNAFDNLVDGGNGRITMSAWIMTTNSSVRGMIIDAEGAWSIQINKTATGKVGAFFDGSGADIVISSRNLADGNWHQILSVFLSGTHYLYVDGVEDNKASGVTLYDLTLLNRSEDIGATWKGVNPFNGLIDDVRIYNRALSAQEVQELYINPYGMFEFAPRWLGAEISTFTQGKAMRGLLNRSML